MAAYLVILVIRAVRLQIVVYFHTGTQAAALVHIKHHRKAVPLLHMGCLFLKGQEQILFQPPVQKGSEFAGLGNREHGYLTQAQLWLFGGGYQTVLGIPVHKHGQGISCFTALRHLFPGKEHLFLPVILRRKIDAEIHFFYYHQFLHSSQFNMHIHPHCFFFLNSTTAKGCPSSSQRDTLTWFSCSNTSGTIQS